MTTVHMHTDCAPATEQSQDVTANDKPKTEAQLQARKRRADALKRIAGIWAAREDLPADSLEYERELRAEWRS